MAAGWPTKVTYANGDVYSASDVNDTNGTLNYINPTSATDGQVLTRNNASSGKVKWANTGLTYITGASFSAVNGFNLPNNTFTATFKNYRIICTIDSCPTASGSMPIVAQLRSAGTNNASSNYYYTRGYYYPSTSGATGGLGTYIEMLSGTAINGGHFILDVLSPYESVKTQTCSIGMVNQNGNLPIGGMSNCQMTVTTSYDALAVATGAGNTMTGNYRVYGYGETYA
jgi:hypothetical protein